MEKSDWNVPDIELLTSMSMNVYQILIMEYS